MGQRYTEAELNARMRFSIGILLAVCLVGIVFVVLYSLIFVTQPIGNQAPNDAAFIDLLKTLAIFLTGSLGGVLASNGLKDKHKSEYEKALEKRLSGNDTP